MSRSEPIASQPLAGRRVAFLGELGSVTIKEAREIARSAGATPVDVDDPALDLLVVGAGVSPIAVDRLVERTPARLAGREVEVTSEAQLWARLGFDDDHSHVHRLYTPSMIADLVGVPVGTLRGWHRRGFLVATKLVQKLAYFDFQEVAAARLLARLSAAGASIKEIRQKLAQLGRRTPEGVRPLSELSVVVEGREILIRQGADLLEPGGQMRMDFEAVESESPPARILDLSQHRLERLAEPQRGNVAATADELTSIAAQLEESGQLEPAIEAYRSFLVGYGATAEVCFLLAELLYRIGDLPAARERYYMAIELNEQYVEARANLGCVLVELGDLELAAAAFRGALRFHADYPDVHFHLARLLDRIEQRPQAEHHWRTFLHLSPESPWADEARARLERDR